VKYRLEATRVAADADAEMVEPSSLRLTCESTTVQATRQSLAVSVLDLVPTRPGEPAGRAIARSVELARHVEQLGYKRYAQLYRQFFRPSEVLEKPYLLIAVPVVAAETDAAGWRLFTTPQQRFLQLIRGGPLELLPPVDSMEPLWHDGERSTVESRLRAAIVGADTTVQAGLGRLVSDTHANEVIIVTDTYEHSDRIDSYERVARIAKNIKRAPETAA
jgi:hypothetical protein